MANKTWVRIIGSGHPHAGCEGWVETNTIGLMKTVRVGGGEMFEVLLTVCPHGANGCFATMGNLRKITDPERPGALPRSNGSGRGRRG